MNDKGYATAKVGQTSEQIVKMYIDFYVNFRRQNCSHRKAMKQLDRIVHIDQFDDFKEYFGIDEYIVLESNSRDAAIAAINHVHNEYSADVIEAYHVGLQGAEEVRRITGKESNADIVINALEHMSNNQTFIGSSLKYSKAQKKETYIKVHSPTLNTVAKIIDEFGAKTTKKLEAIASNGLLAQQRAVLQFESLLQDVFSSPIKYGKRVCSFEYNEGLDQKILSQGAVSYLRDSAATELRQVFDAIANENLAMKIKIADCLFKDIRRLLTSLSKNEYEKLLRKFINTDKSYLNTFLLSTTRNKDNSSEVNIFDIEMLIRHHMNEEQVRLAKNKDTTSFYLGPGKINVDCRPTNTRNPLGFIAAYYINKNELYKSNETH